MMRTTLRVLLLSATVACAVSPAQAAPLTWSAATTLDHKAPFGAVEPLREVECPSTSLCIASSTQGSVATTADPAAASPTWSVPQTLGIDGVRVACPSDALCVAAEPTEGRVFVSTNPTAADPTWTQTADITASPVVITTLLSCPTMTLCVAIDSGNHAIVSTNPGAASPTWTRSGTPVDAEGLTDLECPSTSLCVGVDAHGHTVTTTDPTAAAPTWGPPVDVNGGQALDEISCPTAAMCAASTAGGGLLVSTNPAAASPTWQVSNPGTGISNIDCPTADACVAAGFGGSIWATADATAAAPTWTSTFVQATISDLSCGSTTLCFGTVSNAATATRSTNAFTASPAWGVKTPIVGANALEGAACPADGFCVAVSAAGRIATTTSPTAPTPVWRLTDVVGTFRDVSCATVTLCVAVDKEGYAAISQNPADPAPAWTRRPIDSHELVAVSCPSVSLCVAADKDGGVYVSTTPTGAWQPRVQSFVAPTAVSCLAGGQCAVADATSRLYATADVRATSPVWSQTAIAPGAPGLSDIACPAVDRCVAGASGGETTTSATPFSSVPVWSAPVANGVPFVACPAATFCLGATADGVRVSADGGATWAPPVALSGAGLQLSDVACASASVCVAVDARGRASLGVAPPQSTGPPAIAGGTTEGDSLTASLGTWSAAPVIARQWLRCDAAGAACAPIAGATGATYTAGTADVGHALRVQETATNRAGSGGPVDSTATAVVTAAPGASSSPSGASSPSPDGGPGAGTPAGPPASRPIATDPLPSTAAIRAALAAARRVTGKPAKLATLLKRGAWTFAFRAPSAGKLEVRWLSVPRRRGVTPVVLARLTTTLTNGQTKQVAVRLTAAGRKALRMVRRLKITVRPTFTPVGGSAVTAAGPVTLKR